VCLIVPIKKIGEYDEEDAAGRDFADSNSQADEAGSG
jgi:hypothetical protein